MWEVDRASVGRWWRPRYITLGESRAKLSDTTSDNYYQGVIQALEEYGIPVDHVAGTIQ